MRLWGDPQWRTSDSHDRGLPRHHLVACKSLCYLHNHSSCACEMRSVRVPQGAARQRTQNQCLPGGRLCGADFLVISVSPGPDTFEAILQALGQAEGSGDALLELVQGVAEYTLVYRDARRPSLGDALIAVPILRQVRCLGLDHVYTLEVERSRAAITADDIARVAASRAVLIVVGLRGASQHPFFRKQSTDQG